MVGAERRPLPGTSPVFCFGSRRTQLRGDAALLKGSTVLMHMALAKRRGLLVAATSLMLLAAAHPSAAQTPTALQTLCVLDFQRLGDDSRSDWLEQGLADLMIGTMTSVSPYLVIERRHLRDILQEQRLAASGLVDVATAVRVSRLARAQLLLQGSFVRQGDQLTIQVRLIRVSDQQVLTQTTWSDRYSDVFRSPRPRRETPGESAGRLNPESLQASSTSSPHDKRGAVLLPGRTRIRRGPIS